MQTERKFSRFNRSLIGMSGIPVREGLVTTSVPEGGLCLSSFLVLIDKQNPNAVLLGRLNPDAPWDHIGALDDARVKLHSSRWMIPSSHLMLLESPEDAARRIAKEQLELDEFRIPEPTIISEVYRSPSSSDKAEHWDLGFIFKGTLEGQAPKAKAWSKLEFVDLSKTSKSAIARSHEDILEHAGLKFGSA